MHVSKTSVQFFNKLILLVASAYFLFFPIAFLTNTSETTSYIKVVLTIVTAVVLLLLWVVKAFLQQGFTVAKTRLDLPMLLIVIAYSISTYTSVSNYTSTFGSFNVWHTTLFEIAAFITILYALLSNLNGWGAIKKLALSFFTGSFLVALAGVLTYFDVFDGKTLPDAIAFLRVFEVNGFSPAGNIPSVIILLLSSIFIGVFLLRHVVSEYRKSKESAPTHVFSILTVGLMLLPMVVTLLFWLAVYIPGITNRNPEFAQLNFDTSWQVAISSIKDYKWWGTGPSTYAAAYNSFKPASMNQTELWNVIFPRSGSEYMTWLTTVGLVGFAALAFLVIRVFSTGLRSLREAGTLASQKKSGNDQGLVSSLLYPVVISVMGIFAIYLFTSSTVTTTGVLFMLIAIWLLIEKQWREDNVEEVVFDITAIKQSLMNQDDKKTSKKPSTSYVPVIVGIPAILIGGIVLFYTVQDFRSNLAYTKANRLLVENAPVRDIYNLQQKAIQLNPRRDAYRLAYGNTNISLAEVIAAQNSETLDETTRADILSLMEQAVREVTVASEVIDPSNIINWQSRGNVYRRLIGVVDNAEQSSLDAYQAAALLSPQSPVIPVQIGDLFYLLAVNVEQVAPAAVQESEDPQAALDQLKLNYLSQAEVSYNSALRLKSDYLNAHLGLGQVYREANENDLAIEAYKTVLRLLPADSSDRTAVEDIISQLTPTE